MKKQEQKKKSAPRPTPKPVGSTTAKQRTKPRQFVREVIGELQKVAWPTRQEVISYSTVVLVASIVIAALIFVMDYVFTKAVLSLFGIN
ncbi:MAG: preprotein translocase subunit SecE [Actinomycetota bacterium]|nr:preprotein translocase subunit SecE [Actinomycetota bacterium]